MENIEPISTLKSVICRKYIFQKLTQFSQGNNVLDASAPNIGVSLWRDVCVSSTQMNSPTWNKKNLSLP
jgi:hypothetical protein